MPAWLWLVIRRAEGGGGELPSAQCQCADTSDRDAFLLVKDSLGWKVFLTLFMEMSQTLPAEGFFMWHKVSPQTTGLCVSSAETVHR